MQQRPSSRLAVVPACIIALLSCGDNRSLQSVTLSPAVASSKAQFTATGTYNKTPTTVDITGNTTWCPGSSSGVCAGNILTGATVNAGVAQCVPGFTGSVTVLAGQTVSAMADKGSQLKPFGVAQLNCP
ncbi:MAG TPA: hypothetical protein VFE08_04455 [Candidatus Sulfotelmatobacter sp.]|jgi:hypothetical protein|nr:hypothetical protein [Candidatus Sulfotelmatobacter sp.]